MFVKWPSIEAFHHVCKSVDISFNKLNREFKVYNDALEGEISYKPKIKLHGTNAGITINGNGDLFIQKRNGCINVQNDNLGFASWVTKNKDIWISKSKFDGVTNITIFGEWCGPGIQKGVAINKIDNKIFAIFAVQINDKILIDPTDIEQEIGKLPENTYILPWMTNRLFNLNFIDKSNLQNFSNVASDLVKDIDNCDPWVKDVFNVEGVGEGLVWYPVNFLNKGLIDRDLLSLYIFKTKGEKHQIIKSKKLVFIDPKIAKSINEFVDMVVTEPRLEQGVRETNNGELEFNIKKIGPFIGWMCKDINKECSLELEEGNLDWKLVSKAIASKSRNWFLKKEKCLFN